MLWRALLVTLMGAACLTDLRARRIPNTLVAAVLALGIAHATAVSLGLAPSNSSPGPSLGPALLGVGVGLVAWLPLYAFGVLGAGDVKLFAAAAAWLGPHAVVPASVYAALAGGALGLAWFATGALRRPRLAFACLAAGARPHDRGDTRVPYALAVTAGVVAVLCGAA